LNKVLNQQGYIIPDELIQEYIDYIWVHGQWKKFRLRVPNDMQMYSVYRSSLPAGRGAGAPGFDEFLLDKAVEEGVRILHGEVQSIDYSDAGRQSSR
jgi:hypothetical protein